MLMIPFLVVFNIFSILKKINYATSNRPGGEGGGGGGNGPP